MKTTNLILFLAVMVCLACIELSGTVTNHYNAGFSTASQTSLLLAGCLRDKSLQAHQRGCLRARFDIGDSLV